MDGRGDFNHSGTTDQQDFVDFTSCYNNAPTGCIRCGR
jgi:hypothetical protein